MWKTGRASEAAAIVRLIGYLTEYGGGIYM
jgi:hypothetical protein